MFCAVGERACVADELGLTKYMRGIFAAWRLGAIHECRSFRGLGFRAP
jgi:hypothetical protein